MSEVIKFSDIKLGDCIGVGTYKTVYKAVYKRREVAVLKMRQHQSVTDEAALLKSLGQHPRLATFFGLSKHPDGDECLISGPVFCW